MMTTNNYELLADTSLGILLPKMVQQIMGEGIPEEMAVEFMNWSVATCGIRDAYVAGFTKEFNEEEIQEIVNYQQKYLQRILSLDGVLTENLLSQIDPKQLEAKLTELWEKYNAI